MAGDAETSDAGDIRRQVEFYFSDSNLPIDKYLLELTGGSKNKPVPLKVVHSFKRMRDFQPYSAVVNAVKESKLLNLDDSDEITRKEPLSDRFTDNAAKNRNLVHTASMGRSIYVKGFGYGEEKRETQRDLEDFFNTYGNTRSVRMRRKDDGTFKGSVFVEFDDLSTQAEFLKNNKDSLMWQGKQMAVKAKQEYVDEKNSDILEDRHTSNRRRFTESRGRPRGKNSGGRGRGRGRDGGDRGRNRDRSPRRRKASPEKDGQKEADGEGKDPSPEKAVDQAVDQAAPVVAPVEGGAAEESTTRKRTREDDGGENDGVEAKKVKEA